jgi:hypothetical protein
VARAVVDGTQKWRHVIGEKLEWKVREKIIIEDSRARDVWTTHRGRYGQRLLATRASKSPPIQSDGGHKFAHRSESVPEGRHPHAPSVRNYDNHAMLVLLPSQDRVCTTISEIQDEWEVEREELDGAQVTAVAQGVPILAVRRLVFETEIWGS